MVGGISYVVFERFAIRLFFTTEREYSIGGEELCRRKLR